MKTQTTSARMGPYLLLVVLDGELELGQVVALPGVQLLALVVVSVVQDGLQLAGTSGLIQEVLGESFALLGKLLVLLAKLVLHLERGTLPVIRALGLKPSIIFCFGGLMLTAKCCPF